MAPVLKKKKKPFYGNFGWFNSEIWEYDIKGVFFPQYVKHEIKVEVDLQGFERQQETSSRLFS